MPETAWQATVTGFDYLLPREIRCTLRQHDIQCVPLFNLINSALTV
jgi:hypothetical protein